MLFPRFASSSHRALLHTAVCLFVIGICSSCDDDDPQTNTNTTPVYTGGYVTTLVEEAATYWKDQEEIRLGDGVNHSRVNTIFVQGSDVYAGGIEDIDAGRAEHLMPVYWKNGQKVILPVRDENPDASVTGIWVAGTDVHAIGDKGLYWKNDEVIINSPFAEFAALCAHGSDVYIVGSFSGQGTYWKNGQSTVLPGGDMALDISIDGNDVYVLGLEFSNNGTVYKYWKNGQEMTLGVALAYGDWATSIFAENGDVYITGRASANTPGTDGSIAKYWKNGTAIALTSDITKYPTATDITISGGDVYTAVSETPPQPGIQPVYSAAYYYKNQTPVRLSDPSYGAIATCIFVPR